MSSPLILGVMCVYFLVGIDQGLKGNPGGLIMWSAYGVANLGLWMQSK